MVVLSEEGSLFTLSENGFGKRTDLSEYPRIHRGGKGVIDIKTSERNGPVVSSKLVAEDNEIMIVTQNGIMIRLPVEGISQIGRNTQGVRVINVDDEDRVIDMTSVVVEDEELPDDEIGSDDSMQPEQDAGSGDAMEAPDDENEESDVEAEDADEEPLTA